MKKLQQAVELSKELRGTALSEAPGMPARAQGDALDRRGAIRRERGVVTLDAETVDRHRLRLGSETDASSEAFRLVRTRLLQWLDRAGSNTVAMVSAVAGDGKSLCALNLAFSVANDRRHTVMLVDLDLRRPSLHRYLDLEPELGLDDYLRGECGLADAMVSVGNERMVLLPCREALLESSEILASEVIRDLVIELKSRYRDRVIIFDLPAGLAGDDVLAFLPNVDGALVTVREGRTRRDDLQRLTEMLSGTPIIGVILNQADDRRRPVY